jgi:hypothetical protein
VWGALALSAWAAAIAVSAGFRITVLGFTIVSRDPLRPLAVAAVLLAAGYAIAGRRAIDEELDRAAAAFVRAAPPLAVAAAVAVAVAGLRWGSFAASSVDPYGYVSQAALWARGTLHVDQPFAASMPWPDADRAFAPMGYRPATSGHAIVPSYAPGLPLLMAIVERAAGACGPYYVVPVLGGLCVWGCFLLGRRVATPAIGACAAILLACSPPFHFHLVAPMSDVPAAALWTGAIWAALGGGGAAAPILAGACTGLAILVRPNLAPLAVVIVAFVGTYGSAMDPRGVWKRAGWFAAAVVPACCAVAIVNWRLYGSPLRSGYDDLASAYALANIVENARRYAGWLMQAHSPLIAVAVVGLATSLMTRSGPLALRAALLFLLFTLGLAASYLPYAVFENWWYLRFFLPALPLLLVSMIAAIFWLGRRLPPAIDVFGAIALMTFLASHELRFAIDAGFTQAPASERRYIAVARFIEATLPANGVFVTLQHGGSVRHYSNRLTVRFDRIPGSLDEALASLERAGLRPFILLEDWEEQQFKSQFGGTSVAGRLGWRPLARLPEPGGVNIYDPKSAADATPPELTIIPAAQPCDCRHY